MMGAVAKSSLLALFVVMIMPALNRSSEKAWGQVPRIAAPAAAPAQINDRVKVRDEFGNEVVARVYDREGDVALVFLPDGRLDKFIQPTVTNEPFQPFTADELIRRFSRNFQFRSFASHKTAHFLILYPNASSRGFIETAGGVLEGLYTGLLALFRKNGFPVHEAEFPLVVVVFSTQDELLKHDGDEKSTGMHGYYNHDSNRAFVCEWFKGTLIDQSKAADLGIQQFRTDPDKDRFSRARFIIHEGVHQILSNIGVQPRLARWPLWLVEGLAEYCATPVWSDGSLAWDRAGVINPFHILEYRSLNDPISGGPRSFLSFFGKAPGNNLTPDEYVVSWATVHYLAMKRTDAFLQYLERMSRIRPFESRTRTPDQDGVDFAAAFGDWPREIGQKVAGYFAKIDNQPGASDLLYYAGILIQKTPTGVLRASLISHSPENIERYFMMIIDPNGAQPFWQIDAFPTEARAKFAVEQRLREMGLGKSLIDPR
jgi:hypothetical protein